MSRKLFHSKFQSTAALRRLRAGFVAVTIALIGVNVPGSTAEAITRTPVLAYQSIGSSPGIYTANLDGTHAVLRIPGGSMPLVSPDGTKIAYERYVRPTYQLYVASITGTGAIHLADNPVGYAWSPDSTRLVASVANRLVILTVATGASVVIPGSTGEIQPQWSPDGTLIAGAVYTGRTPMDQVLQRPDGTGRSLRANTFTGPWSPDGLNMLQIAPSRNCLCAVDVLTRATQSIAFLRESFGYVGAAWAQPTSDIAPSAFIAVDGNVPYLPKTPITIYRFTAEVNNGVQIATNAVYPSAGGFTVTDSNGTPPAVTSLTATPSPSYVALAWQAPAATSDFAGAEVRYALGTTPPAQVTDGFDGGRLLSSTRTLGPFPPDQPIAISVFSRDWSGNVGPAVTQLVTTPHQAAVTLTAHASPFDLVYGQRSTVSVSLTRTYDGAPLTSTALTVARRKWATTDPFTYLDTRYTDSNGLTSFLQIPSISYDYTVSYAGDATHAPATAATRIRVARRVTISANRTSAPAGTAVQLTARTAPPVANGQTYLLRWVGDHWITVGPHRTTSTGTVVYTVKTPARGTSVRYRVRVPGTAGYIDGYSAAVTLTGT